jgi:hypothetical protein
MLGMNPLTHFVRRIRIAPWASETSPPAPSLPGAGEAPSWYPGLSAET